MLRQYIASDAAILPRKIAVYLIKRSPNAAKHGSLKVTGSKSGVSKKAAKRGTAEAAEGEPEGKVVRAESVP